MDRIDLAFEFAAERHSKQKRKGTNVPYIVHPYEVYQILRQYTKDEDVLVAAILHDTVEDTGTKIEEIEDNFGENVAKLVYYLSEDDKSMPYMQRKIEHSKKLKNAPYYAKMIKCADCISNWNTTYLDELCGLDPWQWFNSGKEDVKLNYSMSVVAIEEVGEKCPELYNRLLGIYKSIFKTDDFSAARKLLE